MTGEVASWLLLLLRYAVTREPSDRSAALAMADELDSLGGQWRPTAPRFFLKTIEDVCLAIPAVNDRHNYRVLLRHLARIDDSRLRRELFKRLLVFSKRLNCNDRARAQGETTGICGKVFRQIALPYGLYENGREFL